MEFYKQKKPGNCVIYSICNIIQQDNIENLTKTYCSNLDGLNDLYVRHIIEKESTNGWTTITYYNTTGDSKIPMKYDYILCENHDNYDEEDWFIGFAGLEPSDENGLGHMVSFGVNAGNGIVLCFDSLKDNYERFDNGNDFLKTYNNISFLSYMSLEKTLGILPFDATWLNIED